jgi:hypothetical protein
MSLSSDSATYLPGPAEIYSAYTEISFYDGSHGGSPAAEFRVGMEYLGNRALMSLSYDIKGDNLSVSDKIINQEDSFYDLHMRKSWDELYTVPVERNCGLRITARTQHQAWWFLWLRVLPNWESTKDIDYSTASLEREACQPKEPDNDGGGGGSHGGWITIETCHYWAHYMNGALVAIELRYCTYDTIPVADE